MKKILIFFGSLMLLISCQNVYRETYTDDDNSEIQENIDSYEIQTSYSAKIPSDGSGPVTGITPLENPDTVITFTEYDQRIFVPNGTDVNFIYDGIDPEDSYIMYESWIDGYYLTLKNKYDNVDVIFHRLCQIYIVGNPSLTRIAVPKTLRYEQIIWTPREDGTWELRIGSTERGCKSESLNELRKLRDKNYEKNIPK